MISVVVPIYKVEEYIEECITSILNQTYKNIEVILVNDGSPDKCGEICENFKQNDDRITVIHQSNRGLSNARNTGLKRAKGKYICFIDSDDYIENDFLEVLYNEAENNNLDITCGSYTKLYSDKKMEKNNRNINLYTEKAIEGKEFLRNQFIFNDYRMEVWTNLYNKNFLLENKIEFYDGILHEDEEFTPKVFLKANRVKLVYTNGYIYRQREESIMNKTSTIRNVDSIKLIINELSKIFYNEKIDDISKDVISMIIVHLFNSLILRIKLSDINDKIEQYRKIDIKKLNSIIKHKNTNIKVKFKVFILSISPRVFNLIIEKI